MPHLTWEEKHPENYNVKKIFIKDYLRKDDMDIKELIGDTARKICWYHNGIHITGSSNLDWFYQKDSHVYNEWAKEILSHPDLYFRDYSIEIVGLDDLYKAFIPLAQAIKESNEEDIK